MNRNLKTALRVVLLALLVLSGLDLLGNYRNWRNLAPKAATLMDQGIETL